ncbi:DNA polymerase subunit beta [Kitasatospora sp. RB6PN24]|uniref:DNA polymerase subunit beta n=1 Tax=Kitasatospora humi TaxID=2893891 RepID=UPI001E5A618F|nr:DNA polymerase subunit beta [Kitasatospora humi]MCC9310060.1 DNA polymerase subunit beta [Kitasatospora humi]
MINPTPADSTAADWDVVIAGAGPAGLACARAVTEADSALRVLLLEAGRPYKHRPCPVDRARACTGCAGICNVVSGFGGSMHWGDGAKLSLLPSGRRLIDHLGAVAAQELCATGYSWLTEALAQTPELQGVGLTDRAVEAFDAQHLAIREYPVAVLGESDLAQVIEAFHHHLAGRVEVRHTSEVTGAEPDGAGGLRLTVRGHREVQHLTCRHLVLATGRRGVTSTTALLHALGVVTEQPDISVGVRLEMAAPLLAAIGEEHPDLKITQLDGARKVKTFCFCGGPNGGRIKFTNYEGAFPGGEVITLDGHETTERPAPADGRALAANFGLLCQVAGRGDAHQARDSFLASYRELAGGRPFTQSLGAFLARRPDTADWPELAAAMPFQPSVADLTCGRVDALFTDHEHASLTAGLGRVMAAILDHAGHPADSSTLEDQVLVVGPELEFLWERPPIDPAGRVPGLPVYVIGDSAGIAQGIVQAAMTGIAAGRDIAGHLDTVPAQSSTRQPHGAVTAR